MSKPTKEYRVTQTLFIPAVSPRHAARIAKGLQRMTDGEMPTFFTVEETALYPHQWQVDLARKEGEQGYCTQVG